jgi:hypothetical protein
VEERQLSMLFSKLWNFSNIVVPWSPTSSTESAGDIELMPLHPASARNIHRQPLTAAIPVQIRRPPDDLISAIIQAEAYDHSVQNNPHLKTALRLIEKNDLDLDGADAMGQTPLYLAVKGGYRPLINALLLKKADVNKDSLFRKTPLHAAASHSDPTITESLLAGGATASINQEDCIGRRPLHYAAWRGSARTVQLLLHAGANPNLPDSTGSTPLDYALREAHSESPLFRDKLRIIQHLLQHNAQCGHAINPANRTGKPDPDTIETLSLLLQHACDQPKQNIDLIELLLQQPFVAHPHEAHHPNEEPRDTQSYRNYRKAVGQIARRKKIFPFYRGPGIPGKMPPTSGAGIRSGTFKA